MNATSARPEKTKNVSIIQSAMTQRDCSVSGWSCARALSGSDERGDDEETEDDQAPSHCCPGTVGGIAFCDSSGSLFPRARASSQARFRRSS